METKKIENCKSQGMTSPIGGYKPGEVVSLFWCKHSDRCKSQMNFGDAKICLQSPLYDKKKEGDNEPMSKV